VIVIATDMALDMAMTITAAEAGVTSDALATSLRLYKFNEDQLPRQLLH
jgi:hypothetical protein